MRFKEICMYFSFANTFLFVYLLRYNTNTDVPIYVCHDDLSVCYHAIETSYNSDTIVRASTNLRLT